VYEYFFRAVDDNEKICGDLLGKNDGEFIISIQKKFRNPLKLVLIRQRKQLSSQGDIK